MLGVVVFSAVTCLETMVRLVVWLVWLVWLRYGGRKGRKGAMMESGRWKDVR